MKNQNDLIALIIVIVLFLIVGGVAFGTKKDPVQPTPPEQVKLTAPQYPTGVTPVMADALPTGSNSQGGGGGMGSPMGGNAMGGGAPNRPMAAGVSAGGGSTRGGGAPNRPMAAGVSSGSAPAGGNRGGGGSTMKPN